MRQTNIILNLLRSACCNPKLLACSYVFGQFNFRATPIAPPGAKVVAHVYLSKRASWELNSEVSWYVRLVMKHHRCVDCYFLQSRITRQYNTVEFMPRVIQFVEVTLKDYLK